MAVLQISVEGGKRLDFLQLELEQIVLTAEIY